MDEKQSAQFVKSMCAWCEETGPACAYCKTMIEGGPCSYSRMCIEVGRYANTVLEDVAVSSPIEEALYEAIAVSCVAAGISFFVRAEGTRFAPSGVHCDLFGMSAVVTTQKKIGPYRADFFIEYKDESVKDTIKKTMVVECDGHDYHEKTKEQAKRDRKRDREMQSMGLMVFRFTGSEIWSDPFACAQAVVDQLCRMKPYRASSASGS